MQRWIQNTPNVLVETVDGSVILPVVIIVQRPYEFTFNATFSLVRAGI
jgi:hypothetical protein